jgi:hypothetical protein
MSARGCSDWATVKKPIVETNWNTFGAALAPAFAFSVSHTDRTTLGAAARSPILSTIPYSLCVSIHSA